ncbi:MAG: 50S ribosomal protein L29 [Kiritimatiellia bacterium]|jgi:large subunit ribosomal protein L29
MKASVIRELGAEELAQKIRETEVELRDLRLKNAGHLAEHPCRIRGLRRDIARMRTIQNEREAAK